MHRQLKLGWVAQEEHRDPVWLCRVRVRKSKAKLELNLAKDTKNSRKGFYRHINQKRQAKEGDPF